MRNLKRILAVVLALTMLVGLVACGKEPTTTQTATPSPTQSANQPTDKPSTPTPTPVPEALAITVSLPSFKTEHVDDGSNANEMEWYNKLVAELNERTNMKITWEWTDSKVYYDDEHLGLKLSTSDVSDVLVVGQNAAFWTAAESGLFWDLTKYIDQFDNLATIPEATRQSCSYNGKMYGIPRSRTLARNGLGYRKDWLDNLGLAEPTTWENFKAMLHAFTYNDPDKNGVDDTVGLGIDQWAGVFDIMMTWFGVPNGWGLTKDGKLIYKVETEEYKTALKAFRELYSEGLINNGANGIPDFSEVGAGKARTELQQQNKAGCGVQVLDDQRKIEQAFEKDGTSDVDDPIYTLQGYVDTGKGPLCLPTSGTNNMIAISTKTVKTEAQLLQVLGLLNELNDGDVLNLIEYGWEGKTYEIDADGYISLFDTDKRAENGVESANYNDGFNQIIPYFTADANARPHTQAPSTDAIRVLEDKLYAEDIQYCVTNYGASFVSKTYVEKGKDLDAIIAEAQNQYIRGEIDDAKLDEAIKTWKTGGGDDITKEMNELYSKTK